MIKRIWWISCILLGILLTGCAGGQAVEAGSFSQLPTPTNSLLFNSESEVSLTQANSDVQPVQAGVPTVASYFQPRPTFTPQPTSTPWPTPTRTPRDTNAYVLDSLKIYDEKLHPDWSLVKSEGSRLNPWSEARAYSKDVSAAWTPEQDYSNLYFVVNADASQEYLRSDVIGFRFWLNGGDAKIGTDSLAVAVVGSNQYPYWVPNDDSVSSNRDPIFPETRLYYLDFNRAIPENNWVQVEVWLDDLIYDPDYQYVTGFYIKNDADFHDTIWIDQVEIISLGEPLSTATPLADDSEQPVSTEPVITELAPTETAN